MKRTIATALFALASLITVGTATAQDHRIRVKIPFNFIADGTALPAGTYTISSADHLTVLIQNGKQHVTMLSSAPGDDNQFGKGKLVFNTYADQYFLRKILCPNAHLNLELPASKAEKRAKLGERAQLQ
jgi:hypothetical protein